MDEKEKFDVWERRVRSTLPSPDAFDVMDALRTCGDDRPRDRIEVLLELVEAHDEGARSGAFNDE